MNLDEHVKRLRFPLDVFCAFMRAVCCNPVYSIIKRRGKVYQMWCHRHTHRKIISCAKLEQMSLVQFVLWLHTHYPYAKVLFPDPGVYLEVNNAS